MSASFEPRPTSVPLDRRGFLRRTAAALGGGVLLGTPGLPVLAAGGGGRRRAHPSVGASAEAATVVEIRMRSDRTGAHVWFEPDGVLVRPGQVVRWSNESGVHTVTAYHPDNGRPLRMPEGAEPWDSGYLVEPGVTFELAPHAAGVYDFFCRPHEAAGMVGRLVVVGEGEPPPEEPDYATASEEGRLPEAASRAFPSVREILEESPSS